MKYISDGVMKITDETDGGYTDGDYIYYIAEVNYPVWESFMPLLARKARALFRGAGRILTSITYHARQVFYGERRGRQRL